MSIVITSKGDVEQPQSEGEAVLTGAVASLDGGSGNESLESNEPGVLESSKRCERMCPEELLVGGGTDKPGAWL